MKKSLNKFFITIILLLAGILLTTFFAVLPTKKADAATNYRGDFVCISYSVNSYNGQACWALDFGLNSEGRTLSETDREEYYKQIRIMVQELYMLKRAEIEGIYATRTAENETSEEPIDNIEKFAPENAITISLPAQDIEADSVGFSLYFKDVETYKFYYEEKLPTYTMKDYGFIAKHNWTMTNPFKEMVNDGENDVTLAQYYRNKFVDSCSSLSIASVIERNYNPTFVYDYTASSSRMKSTADLKLKDAAGKTHFAWTETLSTILSADEINYSLNTIETGWWYLVGIGTPLLGMGIAIAIIKIIDYRKHKKSPVKDNNEMTAV